MPQQLQALDTMTVTVQTMDHGDDYNDDDSEDDGSNHSDTPQPYDEPDPYPWTAIREDTTAPCQDELTYIESKEEHSALDHAYWEHKAFFDLDDPDLVAGPSGRIDWLIEQFNGTKDRPNRQLIMCSPSIKIGDYEWRIRFYPKGNRTDFLSLYVECTTMQKPDFVGERDFTQMPLPRPAGTPPLRQRVSLAAQVLVVMYNPAEPRVHEHKLDACQYHKDSPDFGWKYFSQEPRQSFHLRKHGQRQAVLKDDRLAFTAYIRLVQDPTGCLWKSPYTTPEVGLSITSLRPFEACTASTAAMVMLIHLRFYRRWMQMTRPKPTTQVHGLRQIMSRALQRRLRQKHLKYFGFPEGCDVVEVLAKSRTLFKNTDAGLHQMFTVLTDDRQYVAHNRLKSSDCCSVQEALSLAPASKQFKEPPVLILELERVGYSETKRAWQRVINCVHLEDHIKHNSRSYTLYGFVTHEGSVTREGSLGSARYTPFVRPGGPETLWYMYDANDVKCLTQKAAHLHAMGVARGAPRPPNGNDLVHSERVTGKAYLVWYIRDDYQFPAWSNILEEPLYTQEVNSTAPQDASKLVTSPQSDSGTAANISEKVVPKPANAPASGHSNPIQSRTPSTTVMDGEDVVMSDTEDDHRHQALINQKICAPSPAADKLASTQDEQVTKKTFAYHSGEWYTGDVKNDDTYHGQGRLICANGDVYRGEFRDGEITGSGTMFYKNGDVYEGSWLLGHHHGHGKLTENKTGNIYEGGWKEGRRHGRFILRGTVADEDSSYCQICYDNVVDTAFVSCGHTLTCKRCAQAVTSCPVCRKPISARLELFGVKISTQ